MKKSVVRLLRVIENILFFASLWLMFYADWKAGLALVLYEFSRGVEAAREYRKHKSLLREYIREVMASAFARAVKELREEEGKK